MKILKQKDCEKLECALNHLCGVSVALAADTDCEAVQEALKDLNPAIELIADVIVNVK